MSVEDEIKGLDHSQHANSQGAVLMAAREVLMYQTSKRGSSLDMGSAGPKPAHGGPKTGLEMRPMV